jgi:zinc transporter 1
MLTPPADVVMAGGVTRRVLDTNNDHHHDDHHGHSHGHGSGGCTGHGGSGGAGAAAAPGAAEAPTTTRCCSCLNLGGDMNVQAVLLHVLGDALGSVGVIISALVIMFAGDDVRRLYVDPVMSIVIVIIILSGTVPLFIRSTKLLLHSSPQGFSVVKLTRRILRLKGTSVSVLPLLMFCCEALLCAVCLGVGLCARPVK